MKIITFLLVIILSAVCSISIFYFITEFELLSKKTVKKKVEKKIVLDKTLHDALVIIEGNGGRGSGFFAKSNGKTYLFSNIHVIMGNSEVTFSDLNGTTYKPVKAEAAKDRDIIRLEMSETPAKVFEIAPPKGIDIPIVISGNPLGLEVIKNVYGKLVGVGPKRVETDAKFVSGNSGSPMINASNQVVGIATFHIVLDEDSTSTNDFTKVRRFGYRLANAKDWLPVDSKKFMAQGKIIDKREEQLKALKVVLSYWWYDPFWCEIPFEEVLIGYFRSWVYDHNYNREQHIQFLRAADEYGFTKGEEVDINRRMQKNLKIESNNLLLAIDRFMAVSVEKWHIPFFKKQWEEQERMASYLKVRIIKTRDSYLNSKPVRRFNRDKDVEF